VGGGLQDSMPLLEADEQITSDDPFPALSTGPRSGKRGLLPDGVNFGFDPGSAEVKRPRSGRGSLT
jgi:hypothetical protein